MGNKYFLRIFLVFALVFQLFSKAGAQNYAIGGTAGPDLTGSVYWLTWDPTISGSKLISAPASSDASHVTNGTYVWQYSPTVRITAVISNQVFTNAITLVPYTPGNFTGDGLDLLYSGNNLPKPGSRGVAGTGLATTGNSTATFDIDVKVAILINGVYTDVAYPGMVIADAESIDSQGEYISADTPNPVAWQLLNKRTQGGASDDHYLMDLSNGGRSFRLRADLAPGNFGVQAVLFARGARNLSNLSMRGSGITAMAIGFVLPFDLGDGPASYGATGHYIDDFAQTNVFSGDGTYAVVNYPTSPLVPKANVYIGADNVDADGNPVFGAQANADNQNGNNDESTLDPNVLPDLKVNQPGNYSITLPVTNGKNVPATLYGWIDFNRDGLFGPDELITATVPANTINQNITLTYPNALFANKIKAGLLYSRFRITTTSITDDPATTSDERSTNFAADGEAEDYNLKSILGVSIAGTVRNDGNGNLDNAITGTGIGTVDGSQLYAYLVSGTTIVNKATVAANGTYTLDGNDNGNYIVALSTNNVAIGGSLASISPNLPLTWVASGEAFGTNNAAGTGVETGTPNLQIAVSTPGTSLDIAGMDFGLDQAPVANTDNVNATAGQPLAVNVLTNDTDADGTVDITSVRLIDPADNTAKTSVTIPNQGTYVVNTATGVVTFTPLVTFSGSATPVRYTIRDNFGAPSASNVIAQITAVVRPAGTPDTDVTLINTPVTTNVKANDGAANAGATVAATNGTNGTTTVTAGNQVTYTPNTGFTGTDTYTYTLTSGALVSDLVTVTVTVSATPIGVADNGNTPIATAITTNVLANDGSFSTGSTVAAGTAPAHGGIVVNADNTITYTPVATYTGVDTYTYTITKNGSTSPPITVTISVVPVGVNDASTTNINTAVATTVKANDGNSATGTTVTNITVPANGTTSVTANVVTYTPANNFIGTDSYTYRLTTADGVVSAPITVNITVRPVGVADASATPVNTAVATTVLTNDGVSGTGATVNSTNGANGTTAVNAGVVTFTPNNNFIGVTTYTYTLTNNGATSAPITVTITVAPVATDDVAATPINTAVATNVTTNDGASGTGATVAVTAANNGTTSVAGSVVTFTPTAGFIGVTTYTYNLTNNGVTSAPATVTVTVRPVGVADVATTPVNTAVATTVLANDGVSGTGATVAAGNGTNGTTAVNAGVVTYTPNTGFVGTDTYVYTLTNNGATSDPITVTVSVTPVGVADVATTPINTAVATNVTTNDGASATGAIVAATQPTNGTTTVTGGVVTYTPNNNFIGVGTYTYTLTNNGATSAPITVTVNVRPVGVADPGVVTAANTPVTTNVKTNDGVSGVGTTVTATPGTNGTTVVNAAGNIVYTPNPGFTGTDTFTYTLTTPDGVVSDPITVTVTVSALPIGTADLVTTNINTPTTTTVTANDGTDGVGATVAIGTAPAHGTAVVNADNTVTFTPTNNYIGVDTYTYTLTKGGLTSGPITVTVSVRPVGVNDASTTPINTPVATTVKTNDGASATGTTVATTTPAHGTTTVSAAGVVTYTPTTGYVGLDTYTYTLTTADGVASAPITVSVTVRPVGATDFVSTLLNTPITSAVKTNDGASAIGTTITVTQPAHGTTTVNAAGEVVYTPTTGYNGVDTYTYTLTTADGAVSDPITVTVNVAPVGVADAAVTTVGTPVTTNVKANDNANTNIAAATVTASQGAHGTTTVNAAGVVTYTPAVGYVGADTYTYTLTTPDGVVSPPVTVTVNVGPVGVADAVVTTINTAIATTVKANDGASGVGTTVTATQPAHGTTTVSASGVVTYTPANNYIGLDTYTYTLTTTDGVVSAPITVSIQVKPVGVADAASVVAGTATNISVKANDGNSGVGTTVTATTPLHGTVTVNAAGVITYTPTAGYTGADSFTYTLTTPDGVISDPITVNLSVGGTLPVGSNDLITTPVNTAITATVTTNDADGVGSTVNAGTTAPAHGTIVVNANNTITYTPANNYVGLDSFTYTLTRAGQTSTQIVVTVGVIPTGVADVAATSVNTPTTINVKANDGASAVPTTVGIGANPAHGTVTVNAAGAIVYTPTTGYTGADTFTYTLTTNDGVESDPITVTLNVGAALPTGVADEVTTNINSQITVNQLSNDPSATPATTVNLGTAPLRGNVVLNANRTITYTPVSTYTGKDTFTYTITQGGQTSLPITVTVNIKPVAVADAVFAAISTPITITVKANDGNSATNNTITVTAPTNGTATVNANGQVVYTPNAGYSGPDSFTYRLTTPDGVVSDPVTVNVTVSASAGVPDTDTTPYNTPVTTNVKANDGAAAATSTVIATNGSHGTTTVNANGTVRYTPNNYVGLDTYTYTLTTVPGGVVSNPITVTVSVKPVGTFDGASTPINTPVITAVKNNDGTSGIGTTVIATNGAHGTTTVNADGSILYTPVTNYTGTDTYTYVLVTSDGVQSDPITVTVSVRLVGVADNVSTPVNVPVATTVKANDGVSGNGANVTPTNGQHGTTTVNAAGVVTYTPNTGYTGLDTYTYTLSIPGAVSDPITVTVSIKGIGVADVVSTVVSTPVTTNVKANDGPINANASVLPTNGQNGTTTVDANGLVTYTPTLGYIGTDTYTYQLVTPDGVRSDPVTVSVTIRPGGTPDVFSTNVNTPLVNAPMLANDGASVSNATVAIVTQTTNGTVVLNANNTITYTPVAGFVGQDTFTYRLINNGVNSDPILVTINVLPVGVPDVSTTPVNTPVTINVKANDGAASAGATVAIVSNPTQGGTVTVNAAGQVVYTPANNFVGVDTFTYTLDFGGLVSSPIQVTVTVYNNGMTLTKVANNAVTKVGDVITYSIVVRNTGSASLTNVTVADPGADAGSITPSVVTILPAGGSATVSAAHTVTQADVDNGGFSNQASVTARDAGNVLVNGPVSDDPNTPAVGDATVTPIAANTAIKLTKTGVATATDITYTFVFENIGNTTLTAVTLTDVKLGMTNQPMTIPGGSLAPRSTFTYTQVYTLTAADKAAGSVTNAAIATGTDGKGNTVPSTGPTGTTTTTLPNATAPKAVDDVVAGNGTSPVIIDVLANDVAGASPLDRSTVTIGVPPANGTITINPDGTITYTPNAGYNGPDAFTYTVKDGNGVVTNAATVNITGQGIGVKIPNLFTPNGDGVNDTFEIRGLNAFAVAELTITNRWGNLVFDSRVNYQNNWTGQGLNEGTYYYLLRVKTTATGEYKTVKGWVMLIRTFKK